MKVKFNKKYVEAVEQFVQMRFGDIESIITLDNDSFKFELLHIAPSDVNPYNIIASAGLSSIKPPVAPDNVLGVEFLIILPKEWVNPHGPDYSDGFVFHIFEELADILLDNGVIVPGSTVKFEHLKNGTKHNAIVVDIPYFDNAYLSLKKGDILFFEIQTVHQDEYPLLVHDDGELLKKIMTLPCVDTQRESLV